MHDHHFLERLDRLDEPEVEEALALYYDAALVRDLLGYVTARGHADRVAIALDDAGEGPFVIVTQQGDFVTALGRGMSVGELPVVPRAAWTAIRHQNQRHAEAWGRACAVARGRGAALGRHFSEGGSHVSREVMLGLHAMTHLITKPLIRSYATDTRLLVEATRATERRDRWRSMDAGYFDVLGRVIWRAANTLVLLAASDLKKRGAADPFLGVLMKHRPTGMLGEIGLLGPLVRAAWAAGKLGGLLLPTYKAAFRQATDLPAVIDCAAGLVAIGSRFSKSRGEVRKALTIAQRPDEDRPTLRRRVVGSVMSQALETAADPEVARRVTCAVGRKVYEATWAHTVPRARAAAAARELPEAVALATATTLEISLADDDVDVRTMVPGLLAQTPQLELADLYFPQRWIDEHGRPSLARGVERVMARFRAASVDIHPPARRAVAPGRNEACPCGSGRKYKRCCAAG